MPNHKTHSIYLIVHNESQRKYVGQTCNFKRRMRNYQKLECRQQRHIYYALEKYGVDAFSFHEIKANITSQDQANAYERWFIEMFDSMDNGFNLTLGGGVDSISEETRKRLSASHVGRKHPASTKRKIAIAQTGHLNHRFGKPVSLEHRKKISIKGKGRPVNDNTRQALSKAFSEFRQKYPLFVYWRQVQLNGSRKKSWETRRKNKMNSLQIDGACI